MESYESLLEEAYKKVKKVETSSDRFEIPKVNVFIEGSKTIINNFMQIASYLRRNPDHFLKYLLKEIEAPGKLDGERLILTIKIPISKINEKVEQYAKDYVICKECSKPDTEIIKEGKFSFIHCLACGARHSISKI
ncbi:MAG: translation initiation factor IF-2 subunit beta [Nanoarchaeota archaeon]